MPHVKKSKKDILLRYVNLQFLSKKEKLFSLEMIQIELSVILGIIFCHLQQTRK